MRSVVLLHGLTGGPYELAHFENALKQQGFTVHTPRLPGHENIAALEGASREDWIQAAEQAVQAASSSHRVLVVGFSMGGLLALHLAATLSDMICGAVVMSVPLYFPPWQQLSVRGLATLRKVPLLRRAIGVHAKKSGPDIRRWRAARDNPNLPAFPYSTLRELMSLATHVRTLLKNVRAPLLVLHGRHDHAVPWRQSEMLSQRVSSSHVTREVLPHSFHGVGLDVDQEVVCTHILSFAQKLFYERREGTVPLSNILAA